MSGASGCAEMDRVERSAQGLLGDSGRRVHGRRDQRDQGERVEVGGEGVALPVEVVAVDEPRQVATHLGLGEP